MDPFADVSRSHLSSETQIKCSTKIIRNPCIRERSKLKHFGWGLDAQPFKLKNKPQIFYKLIYIYIFIHDEVKV